MKRLIALLLTLVMMFALCACGSGNAEDVQTAEVADEPKQEDAVEVIEVPTIPVEELPEEPAPEPTEEPVDDTAAQTDNIDEPWKDQLPDGIDAEIQFVNDYLGFVIFYNETGEDISLETTIVCADENYDILGVFGSYGSFTRNGERHIDVLETRDPINAFQIDCSIGHVRDSVRADNDAISMTSTKNDDGSISVKFESTADYEIAFFATIYYVDKDNKIIGYETSSPQFIYDMGGTFEVPNFEYDDYFILIEI